MKKYSLLIFGALFTLLICSPAFHAQNRNTITGHVFNGERIPVPDIFVELQNEVNSTIARVKTNGSGRYFFSSLSSGRFAVRVLPYGTDFEEQSAEVEISNNAIPGRASAPQNVQQDFYLRVRRSDADSRSLTGAVFVQDVPEDARKAYEKAVESLKQKNTDEGIQALQSALTIFPEYYPALLRLGEEYVSQQKWDLAYDAFKKSVSVNERSFGGWYGLSFSAYGSQKSDEAVAAAQKAVLIRPDSVDAHLLLGICQRKYKQYAQAEDSLKKAEKLAKGKTPDVHWNLALLYAHNLKKYNAAADHLELYLKTKPDTPDVENIKKLIKQFREQAGSDK